MELALELRATIKSVSSLFFNNGNLFTIEEGELTMLNEALGNNKLSEEDLVKIKANFTDLIYAVVYYSMGNVFKSVSAENYRQPMYNFVDKHFVDSGDRLRKVVPRNILAKLLQAGTDSDLSRIVIANTGGSISECVGLFNDPIRALTNLIHDKLSRLPNYQLMTFDFRLNTTCDILYIKLGEDIRHVMFRKLYPEGFYDGVELAVDGLPRHSNDFHVFDSYCVSNKEED